MRLLRLLILQEMRLSNDGSCEAPRGGFFPWWFEASKRTTEEYATSFLLIPFSFLSIHLWKDVPFIMLPLATRNKKLPGAPGIATRSKDAASSSWPYYQEQGRY